MALRDARKPLKARGAGMATRLRRLAALLSDTYSGLSGRPARGNR